MPFTHLDDRGKAHIVDINSKPVTQRTASARAVVTFDAEPRFTRELEAAAIAAGQIGAKRTSSLIPLCHPIPLGNIDVVIEQEAQRLVVTSTARATWRTGVEMEALTAVTIAALTLVAGLDADARIDGIVILEKRGGKSDPWGYATTTQA